MARLFEVDSNTEDAEPKADLPVDFESAVAATELDTARARQEQTAGQSVAETVEPETVELGVAAAVGFAGMVDVGTAVVPAQNLIGNSRDTRTRIADYYSQP